MEKQIWLLGQCTYFVLMKHFKFFAFYFLLLCALNAAAQTDVVPVFKGGVKASREKIYNDIIKYGITKNLSLPLADSTEENWESAFDDLELIHYKEPWVNDKIRITANRGGEVRIEFKSKSKVTNVFGRINRFSH